jgi:hypothetical protein
MGEEVGTMQLEFKGSNKKMCIENKRKKRKKR